MTRLRALAGGLAAALVTLVAVAPAQADDGDGDGSEPGAVAGSIDLPGEQIGQSSDQDAPTPVTAGVWRGELGPYEADDGVRWFEYSRVSDDSTLHVSALSPGADPGVADALELEVFTPGGDSCLTTSASTSRSDGERTLLTTQLWVGVQQALADEDSTLECLTQNRLLIAVSRGSNGERGDAPYAMRVVEEAALEPDAELEPATERPEAQAPDVDSAREPLEGAGDLTDAPEAPTGRYRGSLASDRTVVYRVPDVGWGQTVKTSLEVDPVELGDDVFLGPDVSLRVLSPMLSSAGTSGTDEQSAGSDPLQLVASAGPIGYADRLPPDVVTETPTFLPGDHYVVLTLAPPDEGEPVDVDYTLEVEVAGDVAPAPAFVTEDAYLVADGDEQPVITGVGTGGFVASALAVLRYVGAGLLAVAGLVALGLGVRTLRVPRTA